jgi:hypothetical protein
MNSTNDVPFRQWALINQTERTTVVTPLSGYRRRMFEDDPQTTYLEPNPAEDELGRVVLESLNISRFVDPRTDDAFFEADRIVAANKRWHADFMTRFRYRSLRKAYENMLCCLAKRSEGRITIRPYLRDRSPGYWTDMPEERTVDIPATDDISILGAATKLALSRCEPQLRDRRPL